MPIKGSEFCSSCHKTTKHTLVDGIATCDTCGTLVTASPIILEVYAMEVASMANYELAKAHTHPVECRCDVCCKFQVYIGIKETLEAWERANGRTQKRSPLTPRGSKLRACTVCNTPANSLDKCPACNCEACDDCRATERCCNSTT
jgi:hypothetical protein